MPRFLVSFLLLALATSSLHGATRKLRLRSVLHDPLNSHAELYVPVEDGGLDDLYLALNGLSESQEVVVNDGKLQLYSSKSIDPEKPLENLVASAPVPDGIERAVALIFPADGKSKLSYRMIVLDDSAKAFPKGATRVLNMTSLSLAMKAGEHSVKLPSGKLSAVPPVKKVDHMNRAPTAFYREGDDEIPWVLFAERPMPFSLNARNLIIVYGMPNLKAPRLRTIVDTDLR